MRSTLAFLAIGASLVSATPTATTNSCGVSSNTLCANTTTAIQPCNTLHPNPNEEVVVCSVASYFAWPAIVSWQQCHDKCSSSTGCKSFQWYYYQPTGEAVGEYGGGSECQLFNKTIASYTVKCPAQLPDDGSIEPLAGQYYDVGCAKPPLLTSGTVPTNPSTDPSTGTCDSERLFNNNQQQWAQIEIVATPINQTQAQCQAACKKQSGCKSYYYGDQTEGFYSPPLSDDEYYWPTQGPNGFQPALCLLLSQPVNSYTTSGTTEGGNSFYDVNCPISS